MQVSWIFVGNIFYWTSFLAGTDLDKLLNAVQSSSRLRKLQAQKALKKVWRAVK